MRYVNWILNRIIDGISMLMGTLVIFVAISAYAAPVTRYETYVETRADRTSSAIHLDAYVGPGGVTCDQGEKDNCVRGCRSRQPANARYLVDAECSWDCSVKMVPAWPAPIPIMQCEKECRCLWFGVESLLRYQ